MTVEGVYQQDIKKKEKRKRITLFGRLGLKLGLSRRLVGVLSIKRTKECAWCEMQRLDQ
jgi:hypothetical protein